RYRGTGRSKTPWRSTSSRCSLSASQRHDGIRCGAMSLPVFPIRPAAPADLTAIGRLGALLVRMHHELDPDRFIPATPQTEQAYGSFLGTQLDKPDIIILAALAS